MQLGRVVNLRGYNKIFSFLKENNILLILVFFYLFGLGFGIFSLKSFEGYRTFSEEGLNSFITLRSCDEFFKIAVGSFLNSFSYIVLVFIFGSCIFGVVVLPFVVFSSGLNYGSMIALLYSQYALKGIAFNAVVVLPSAALFVAVLILAARQAVGFSLKVASLTFPRTSPANLSCDFKYYFLVFLKYSLAVLLSALLDAFISCNFLNSLMI